MILFFSPVIFVVFTVVFCTVTGIFFESPLFSFTTTVALPARFCATNLPVLETFTTFVLLDFHDNTESPFDIVTFNPVVD